VPQQTGVPLKHTQHMQPASMQAHRQSQHAWHMAQQALSPLVQVMQQPSSVMVQVQLHIAMLHWHIVMPFFMHTSVHMPSHSILQRFCMVAHDISSSQVQVIFIPPAQRSIFMVQRGTMLMLPIAGMAAGMVAMGMGELDIGLIMPRRSDVICANI
jgi:hypothetical protein